MAHILDNLKSGQRGFTLIEMLVALAITGFMISGVASTVSQVITVNALSANRMQVIKQVENAGNSLFRDAQMAKNAVPGTGTSLVKLTLTDLSTIEYTITNNQLKRIYTDHSNPAKNTTTLISENIDISDGMNSCSFNAPILTVKITASTGNLRPASETRTFQISLRPY
jgi:prepilin-type N-terminal cleavage/methylation domain-containing protein